jgi:hypothetical protein
VGWVHLVRRPLIGLLYQPQMIDDECEAVGGMRIGRGHQNTLRKPTLVPLSYHKFHMTWIRTQTSAVGNRRLTTWAMARPAHDVARDHLRNVSLAKAETCVHSILLNRNINDAVVLFYGFYAARICLLILLDTKACVTRVACQSLAL